MGTSILRLYLSGGASNTAPLSSLGGAVSQQHLGAFSSLRATWSGTPISGITLGEAVNVPVGTHSMLYTPVNGMLEVFYNGVYWHYTMVGSDGLYTLEGDFGSYLTVNVVTSSLPGAMTSGNFVVATVKNNLLDDVTASDRSAGRVEYRCAYIKNEGTVDTGKVQVTIAQQPALGFAEVAEELITTPTHNGTMTTAEQESKQLRYLTLQAPWLKTARVTAPWSMLLDGKTPWALTADEGVEVVQDSNGTTEAISRVIVDEIDSTYKLAPLAFGPLAQWDTIKAGRYVSFWIKRVTPGASLGTLIHDRIQLKITQTK